MAVVPVGQGSVKIPGNLGNLISKQKVVCYLESRERGPGGDGYQWNMVLFDQSKNPVAKAMLFSNGQCAVVDANSSDNVLFITDCQVRDIRE